MVHDFPHEQRATAVTYLTAGLWAGERCIHVSHGRELERLARSLDNVGVDVERERHRGALVLAESSEYHPPGRFEIRAMAEGIRQLVATALAEGFPSVRLSVDMRWTIQMGVSPEMVVAYETLVNEVVFPDSELSAICMYPRGDFEEHILCRSLAVHPQVVHRQQVLPNAVVHRPHEAMALELFLRKATGRPGHREGPHVLIADRHPDSAAATADVLEAHGYRTTVTHDGRAALDAIELDPPDVALLELDLGEIGGLELAGRLREVHPEALLVATTTGASWQQRSEAQQAGFRHWLVKPYSPAQLVRILGEAGASCTATGRGTC